MRNFKFPTKYDTLNYDQKLIFNMLIYGYVSNQHYFLTGNAGVGKTYLINVFDEFCRMNAINLMKVAPTGVAATNIQGTTLHKGFKLPLSVVDEKLENAQYANIQKTIRYVDILFIEEVSMVRIDIFDNVMKNIQEANKVRARYNQNPIMVILSGDFGQLMPVITEDDRKNYTKLTGRDIDNGCCYNSHYWIDMDFKPIMLTTPMRQQDVTFCRALDNIKIGIKADVDYLNNNCAQQPLPNGIWLCGYNNTANQKNVEGLYNLPGNIIESKAVITGKANIKHTNLAEKLLYKKGARVMMTMNEGTIGGYHNGSLGTLVDVRPNRVRIKLDTGRTVDVFKTTIPFYEYDVCNGKMVQNQVGSVIQFPFKIGYAVTIHKSQGQTYDTMNLVPEIFMPGQLYVAMSRCKNLDQIYIQPDKYGHRVTETKIMPNPEIIKFLIKIDSEYNTWKQYYLSTVGFQED